jgi:hypothetical protein
MDKAGTRMGYMLGISQNKRPSEAPLATNQGDFQGFMAADPTLPGGGGGYLGVGARLPRERKSRLAGDAFNLNLIGSTGNPPALPAPYIGGAELRNLDIVS